MISPTNLFSLQDKVAVITGAGRGIGKTIASQLAQAGAKVALADIEAETVNQVADALTRQGTEAAGFVADVSQFESVQNFMQQVQEKFGRLDILVNNAGITRDGLLLRMKEKDWDAVLGVNLKGCYNCCRAAISTLLRQRAGSIVNVASIIGLRGNAGQVNYAASKAGIIGLTKSLAKEVASRGVRVNAVAPGFIDTEMTRALKEEVRNTMLEQIPLGRFGIPDDVARVVWFLASEASSYITGQVIIIDGGMYM